MRTIPVFLVLLISLVGVASAQFGSFGDAPVEITADGETRFEGGVAVAEDNVQIHYGDISIYCDYAEYNPDSRDVLLVGNIRLYSPEATLTGQRALFNLETRQMRALEMRGGSYPMLFRAFSLRAPSLREFRGAETVVTTDDSSEPGYHVRSRTVRIYPNDRVVLVNSTLYLGQLPIFWFPYLYSSLNDTGFQFLPGYDSRWGAFLLTSYGFPIGSGDNIVGRVRADYRTELGFGFGFEADLKFGKDNRNFGQFLAYYAYDIDPEDKIGGPGEPAEAGDNDRYRITYKQRLFLTDDIYATVDVTKLSDRDFLEDYFPSEFRTDPQPDSYVGITKWDEFYTINLMTRWQMNDFFDTTERLPELAMDFKQHQLFGWPIYYTGETSAGYYRRAFPVGSTFPDYESFRFDTFHQLSVPQQFFNWLNIIPKGGFRLTAYNKSGQFVGEEDVDGVQIPGAPALIESSPLNTPTSTLDSGGAIIRPFFNAAIETSFKLSRAYEGVQSRFWGLDGLRHVIQPYNLTSFVVNLGGAGVNETLQFDRVVPSTQLLPIDVPQFTAIDSLDTWAISRFGVRNRLQTRRDNGTFEWFTLDTFFEVNFDNPYSDGDVSNFFNVMSFRPVPWFGFEMISQIPLVDEGFTEFNTRLTFMPVDSLLISFGPQIIQGNSNFADSSQINFYAYWRINDNWAFSIYEQYEAEDNLLLYQRYMIHRDLSSWVASIGAQVRDSKGSDADIGVLFVLTLKDAPQVSLPLAFDAGTEALGPGASN